MLARFSRLFLFTGAATLAVTACTRETPLQPMRANVVAQDTAPPPPAPPNDNRDSARFIPSVPFFDSTDVTNATVEPGEVTSFCHDTIGAPTRTVWYVYVSQAPGTVQLTAQLHGPAPGVLSTYFVSADTLIPVGCNSNFGPVTFNADSGLAQQSVVSAVHGQLRRPGVVHGSGRADVLLPGRERSARDRDVLAPATATPPGELRDEPVRSICF